MRVVALISGGKDSLFNIVHCITEGHEIVALANLRPGNKDEMDSYMYQTVGHHAVDMYAEAMNLPLFRRTIEGGSIEKGTEYVYEKKDEVEDLFKLLENVKKDLPIEGVSVGAILSDYQRVRVENVCVRLGLTPLAYLWRRDQKELLKEMISCSVHAVLIKVAALGLTPEKHLGKSLEEMQDHLLKMENKYGLNPCGEGGEYETFTLDCPLFKKRIIIEQQAVITHSEDAFAPVAYLNFEKMHLEDKNVDINVPFIEKVKNLPLKRSCDVVNEAKMSFTYNCEDNSTILLNNTNVTTCRKCILNRETVPEHYVKKNDRYSWLTISGVYAWQDNDMDIEKNTSIAMNKLSDILLSHDFTFKELVAVHLYVENMENFRRLNSVYSTYFSNNPPIRICVEGCLPDNVLFQLDCTGYKNIQVQQDTIESSDSEEDAPILMRHTMHVQGLSHWAPANIGPYSQSTQVGDLIYVAGQIPLVPGNMQIVEGGICPQSYLSLKHVHSVLKAMSHLSGLHCVRLAICYLVNVTFIPAARKLWGDYTNIIINSDEMVSQDTSQLLQCVVVPNLPRGALIEWEVYATKEENNCVQEQSCHTLNSEMDLSSKCISQYTKCNNSKQRLYSFVCTTGTRQTKQISVMTQPQVLNVLKATFSTVKQTLDKYEKKQSTMLDYMSAFRIFFCSDLIKYCDMITEYKTGFKDVFGEETPVIPPAFIPIISLEDDKQLISIVH